MIIPGSATYIYKTGTKIDKKKKNKYQIKQDALKKLVQDSLWDSKHLFFKTKLAKTNTLANAREAIGFIPWDFNLPDDKATYAKAWDQLLDTGGFKAPWGLTTAERREPTVKNKPIPSSANFSYSC